MKNENTHTHFRVTTCYCKEEVCVEGECSLGCRLIELYLLSDIIYGQTILTAVRKKNILRDNTHGKIVRYAS